MATIIPILQVTPGASREAELTREGWLKKTTIGEPRLSEIAANYRSLGYQVHVETYRADGEACNTCFEAGDAMGQLNGTIYIRQGAAAADQEADELF
jgi:hypothetical protein